MIEEAPHDAHVQLARQTFRDVGFELSAIRFPRPTEALAGLKRFNGVSDDWKHPIAWGYFPNEYMRDNWQRYYGAPA